MSQIGSIVCPATTLAVVECDCKNRNLHREAIREVLTNEEGDIIVAFEEESSA